MISGSTLGGGFPSYAVISAMVSDSRHHKQHLRAVVQGPFTFASKSDDIWLRGSVCTADTDYM